MKELHNMRPNILYIHSHDTGRYVQPYGHAIATPHLQHLSEEGVLFRQAFTVSPTCSPSRAALLTGEYPHQNGMTGLAHRGFSMTDYGHHLIHTLRKAGYFSALSGIQHIAHGEDAWKTIGYDQCLGGHDKAHLHAAEFLRRPHSAPFFLSVGFFETHRPFPVAHPDEDLRYCLVPPTVPDTPETRLDMAGFRQSARILDGKMGTVLSALEETGLSENTLVICTTDHGIAFPRMKCNLEDSGTGVMLIMRGPGGFSGGKVIDEMVSHLDIFPTICELLGLTPEHKLEGKSLLPLLNGTAGSIHEELFFEISYHAAFEPIRAIRTRRWKYIRRFDPRKSPVLSNCDDSPSKNCWMENGWTDVPPDTEALYDLVLDQNEKNNLILRQEYGAIAEDMRDRLGKWMRKTGDPLLNGDVPMQAAARLVDRDSLSAYSDFLPSGMK
ncbi:MAG: sulfatase [Victivallales bacterium]